MAGLAGWAAVLGALFAGDSSGDTIPAAAGKPLDQAIAKAKAGDVITLEAGTYAGGIRLPAGIGLRGAGYRETTIVTAPGDIGVSIEGGQGVEVADLSIRGGSTALRVKDSSNTTVRRVRVSEANNGIRFSDVAGGRIENVVAHGNRYGVIVARGQRVAVVNCTMAENKSLALSLASGAGHAAFNNCLAGESSGVFVGTVEGLLLDHNVYFTLFVGKLRDEVGRRSLQDWKYLSGLDAHSAEVSVKFRDAPAGDLRPAGTLTWSLARASTTDWGVAKLGGFDAPDRDIDGHAREGRFDAGAYEMTPTPPRPPDGTLVVRSDAGIKSAGLFDSQGREVAYLFHNLPLPAGEHPYWFPVRDYLGRRIPAGPYEVRSVEADHRWEYLGWVGDTGEAGPAERTASAGYANALFDDAGRLFAVQGWSEDATNIRCFDGATGKIIWTFPGAAMFGGLSIGTDGLLYYGYVGVKGWDLLRIDPASGRVAPDAKGRLRTTVDVAKEVYGFAELDGKLFVTDRAANKIRIGPSDGSGWRAEVEIPAPTCPVSDQTTHVVWFISDDKKVIAMGPDGSVIAERDFSALAPRALAAGHGRLAVATGAEGVVRVLELPDPKAKAKSGWTVGRGDGPFGPYLPDRFLFQQAAGGPKSHVGLAIGPKGELAVIDQNRLLVFDAKGAYLWGTFGLFGNNTAQCYGNTLRLFDTDGRRSLVLKDGGDGSPIWRPEGYYDMPVSGGFLGTFDSGGKTYAVTQVHTDGIPNTNHVVMRLDGFRFVPVSAVIYDPKRNNWFTRKDANRDGRLDARDGGEVVKGPDGKPYGGRFDSRYEYLQPDGSILLFDGDPERWGTLWHPARDADGTVVYRLEGRQKLPRGRGEVLSPYNRKEDTTGGFTAAHVDPRGGFVANLFVNSSPDGAGLLNNGGTDILGFDRAGRTRWFHALDRDKGLEGLEAVGPVLITAIATTAEVINLDRDGLCLGSFSPPERAHYQGYFIDHPKAVRGFRSPDGRDYALLADNYNGRHHWFRLDGADRIRPSAAPASLSTAAAATLAAAPTPPAYISSRPAQPLVKIPRLPRPFPIDGGLAKWREVKIEPQIVVTPESSGGGIDGPLDCSAVIRLAYEGNDLYAQFLVFDDVVSFHQDVNAHYKQDGVEMCLNGFMTGFKFDSSVTTDGGPIVLRDRFFFKNLTWAMPESHAPRSIKVLDDARDVSERDLIEAVYDIDMSRSRVIVVEYKLPIDAVTYKDSAKELKDITPWRPGRDFWIGFLINDNDVPGTTVQNFLLWPPTYNNFASKEEGARAVLE
jgi:nitrous oxidase accessory protein NosD